MPSSICTSEVISIGGGLGRKKSKKSLPRSFL